MKGLLNVISKLPGDKSRFVTIAEELLDAKIGPSAKLSVYKFVYEETKNRLLLERARSESAKKIREWAAKTLKRSPDRKDLGNKLYANRR